MLVAVLRAGGLTLRQLTEDDAAALLDLRLRNRAYFRGSEPSRAEGYFTVEGQREELRRAREAGGENEAWIYGIFVDGPTLIGRIAISGVIRGPFQSGFLGYALDEGHADRGYATQAVGCITEAALDRSLHRVQAAVVPENEASRRVLEKSGYRYEGRALHYLKVDGRWRDHDIFAITVEDTRT